MESTTSLKRKTPDFETNISRSLLPISQQSHNTKDLHIANQGIIGRVQEASALRRMYNDKNIDLLDRLDNVTDWSLNYLWHKICYSTFTSENKINRLKVQCTPSSRGSDEKDKPEKITRSSISSVNWDLCLFCQMVGKISDIRNITTFSISNRILSEAQLDLHLSIRLAGVNDLILASEGKYHLVCYSKFL